MSSHSIEKNVPTGLSSLGKVLTITAILGWLILFTVGLIINSEPYRNRISGQVPDAKVSQGAAWVITLLSFTPSNIAALSLLSGLLGALGRKATLHACEESSESEDFPEDPINPYLSGLIRGFFMYLLIISGSVIIMENPFAQTTLEQYVRLAGLISIAAFVISYNPRNFSSFFQRALGVLKPKEEEPD